MQKIRHGKVKKANARSMKYQKRLVAWLVSTTVSGDVLVKEDVSPQGANVSSQREIVSKVE